MNLVFVYLLIELSIKTMYMKKLILIGLVSLMINSVFSQYDLIKTNLCTYIKTSLLAPTTFKIHRYRCEQISPPAQKMQADLKKLKAKHKNEYILPKLHRDSLMVIYSALNKRCDSINLKIKTSSTNIERQRLGDKIKEVGVKVPGNQEFILWQAARGIDTTLSHLAFTYSNQLKKLPSDTNEFILADYKIKQESISNDIELYDSQLLLLSKKDDLINLYLEEIKELPVYKTYIVYQALTKGGQNSLFEENYYFNKNYKCLGQEYSVFWDDLSIVE